MKGGPVDPTVMTLQDILDYSINASKEISVHLSETHDVIGRGRRLLPERPDIPNPDGLIQRRRDDEVLLGMEGSAHDIVIMPCQHGHTGT
jgi:hypothetical protein